MSNRFGRAAHTDNKRCQHTQPTIQYSRSHTLVSYQRALARPPDADSTSDALLTPLSQTGLSKLPSKRLRK